jgi:hypothetical protein
MEREGNTAGQAPVAVGTTGRGIDIARQAANVAGALFQVGATAFAAAGISEVTDRGTPLIEPALYAFFVWGPIFLLSLAYAVYGALPANRDNPLLRRIGWFTAGAFLCIGLWSVFVPEERLLFALAMLAVAFACLLVAYLRAARSDRGDRSVAGGWLISLPLGIFLGWLTAANAVSLSSEAVRFGLVEGGSPGEAVLGSALLLLGGVLAAAVVRAGRKGAAQGYLAYGGTVLWALVGIVVNQYDASLLTTTAAMVAAVPVVLALVRNLSSGGWPRRRGKRAPSLDATA